MERGSALTGVFLVDAASSTLRVLQTLLILPGIGVLIWGWMIVSGNPSGGGRDLFGIVVFALIGLGLVLAGVLALFSRTGVKLTGFRFDNHKVKCGVAFSKADSLEISNIREFFKGSIEDYPCSWQEKESSANGITALTVVAVIQEIPFIRSVTIDTVDQKVRSVGTNSNLRNNLAAVIDGKILQFDAPLMTRFDQIDKLLKSRPDMEFKCRVMFEGDLGNVTQAGIMYGAVGAVAQGAYNKLVKQPRAEREAENTFAGLLAHYGWEAPQFQNEHVGAPEPRSGAANT